MISTPNQPPPDIPPLERINSTSPKESAPPHSLDAEPTHILSSQDPVLLQDQTVLKREGVAEKGPPRPSPFPGLKTVESNEESRGPSSDSFADPLRISSDAKEDRIMAEEDQETRLNAGVEYTSTEKDSSTPRSKHTSHLHLNLKPPSPQPWELVEPPTTYSAPQKLGGFQGMVFDSPSTRPSIPKSSYYFGPPPSDAAFGTPPVGQIGVHHPREIIRIERDYTGGELTQFAPIYPLELEGRLTPTHFLESINAINELLISAHSIRHSFWDNMFTIFSLQLSRLFLTSHYEKEMNRLEHLIEELNSALYNPVGLNILWPRDVAFLFLEIEYYSHPPTIIAADPYPDTSPVTANADYKAVLYLTISLMESYTDATPLWDLAYTSSLPQLPDDDFLTLLQKQFPNSNAAVQDRFLDVVNPQTVPRYSFSSITPPSEDSSPSPPNMNNDIAGYEDSGDPALKRKASGLDVEGGPSQKSQHTLASKKSAGNRKKSGPPKDETRLLKRKEQNRAAQRAFRERKEKHVKDLEDKVAELEAMNEQANHENDNLRDLLTRLQTENMALKQFTFTVPKSGSPQNGQASTSFASQSSDFTSSPRSPASPSVKSPDSAKSNNNSLDWASLTTFDPAMLNLLDEGRQSTATDGSRPMDYNFGPGAGLTPNTSFTTIASNPLFMSYASAFDSASPIHDTNDQNNGFFDLNSLTWSPPPQQQETASLDDLFTGYMTRGLDYPFMTGSSSLPSESPVNHHTNVNNVTQSPASSSPSSSNSDPLFETRDSSVSESDTGHFSEVNHSGGCPKTKGELARKIVSSGMSPFAPPALSDVRKSESAHGPMITCTGTTTTLPKTQKSDDNVEVLSAWRSITSDPKFKDVDIDHLCSEFTSKAKCDGTKVVLDPQGVDSILQNLARSVGAPAI